VSSPWSVCVFCGSNTGADPRYRNAAERLGAFLAERGHGLVYGGGRVGLMGALADAALAAGGRVIGVIPEPLVAREIAHTGLTELHVTTGMHARKARMLELADAFVAMPGGFGTLDELFEVLTWAQLGIHAKPIGLLNLAGYFDPLVRFLDHAVDRGFVRAEHRDLLPVAEDPGLLLELMARHTASRVPKWIARS
jgi:uncharacterized protein (TIGR00730 family)